MSDSKLAKKLNQRDQEIKELKQKLADLEGKSYDSEADTRRHQQMVAFIIHGVIREFIHRIEIHDIGKLGEHEKPIFDRMTPKLAGVKFGSEEYEAMRAEMKPALDHHYKTNRHHPEFKDGTINWMNLIDLLEMLCDWLASGRRHADGGDLFRSIEMQQKRFGYSDEMKQIFINTAQWLKEAGL